MLSSKKRILILFLLSAALSLCSCKRAHSPAVFGYVSCDASFSLEFPSPTDAVVCRAEREGGSLTLSVTSPERSADLRVICSPDGCVIIPCGSESAIPLSSRASDGLTSVFSLLYRGSDGSESVTRSDDGQSTVITYPDGAVTVGADMMPSSVELFSDHGKRRIAISGYNVTLPAE